MICEFQMDSMIMPYVVITPRTCGSKMKTDNMITKDKPKYPYTRKQNVQRLPNGRLINYGKHSCV